jgi:uridine phosphorylase
MGELSRWELHEEHLPSQAVVFPGNTPRASVERIVQSYDRVVFTKHDNYAPFIVESGAHRAVLAFQIYGAPLVADLLHVLADGGVAHALFIGAAYGCSDLRVGDCVVPDRVRCLDGFSTAIGAPDFALPNPEMRERLVAALTAAGEPFRSGPSVSVPSSFFHGDSRLIPDEVLALEIEAASFLWTAEREGIAAAAALVVSDTKTQSLFDGPERLTRHERILRLFAAVRSAQLA